MRNALVLSALQFVLTALPAGIAHGAGDPPSFAADALLPKKETGAAAFLKEHGKYDGRGIAVAIFDSGLDPGAPGLQVTTEGKPKIVDMIDASGSGDVDMSTVRELEDGTLEGLTGRRLKPAKKWKNPSGKWRVGVKPAWEFYPGGLVTRLRTERRRDFDENLREKLAAADRELAAWDEAHPDPTRAMLRDRADRVARRDQLVALGESWDDPGPVFDCVAFHDGKTWRAAIDTDEDGEFDDEKTLTNFRDEHEYATFGEIDLLNFALNVFDDGDILSIVVDAGGHATHVAGIVAAHFPDRPEMNGVAPGAQIVSVKIGDSRLGSTSVGTGDVRGFATVVREGIDLVNMSYGGPSPFPDKGRIEDLRSELVNEHGVIYVCSAGNAGPALTTVGGPGGTTSATIGIGATVSPAMMAQQYSMREPYDEQPYNWTSHGPAPDGFLGVDFSAPGGAIAPVPNNSLRNRTLMNGTSMASPNVCGGIALLLSGLKAEGREWTPYTIRRALAATARPLPDDDPWGQGAGVVQIDAAWNYLEKHAGRDDDDVRYDVTVSGRRAPGGGNGRGIYLREPYENDRPFSGDVSVSPRFPRDHDKHDLVAFEKRVRLEASHDWVDVPDAVMLMHGGRSFNVEVDPTGLPPGAHFATIRGFDSESPDLGPLFTVPVTVLRTLVPGADDDWSFEESLELKPGRIERRFLAVPEGATWADIAMRRRDSGTPRRVVLHTLQLLVDRAYDVGDSRRYLTFDEDEERIVSVPAEGGRTMEVTFVQNWSSPGESSFDLEVIFHGLRPSSDPILVDGDVGMAAFDVTAPLRAETVAPAAKLETLRKTLAPVKRELRALSEERDALWDGRRVHELVATYEWEVEEAGSHSFRPTVGEWPDVEDTFESTIWIVFDGNGRRLHSGAGIFGDPVDLEKGKHRLVLHLRHDDREVLEAAGKLPLHVDRKLKPAVTLGVHSSATGARSGDDKFADRDLRPGETARVYLAAPAPGDWPDGAAAGDLLLGSITLGKKGADLMGAGMRPDGWPLVATVPPSPKDEEEPTASDGKPEDDRDPAEELREDIRDLQVERLGSLTGEDDAKAFEALARTIEGEWPDHLPLWSARLARADGKKGEGDTDAILAAADAVISRVDTVALAAHFGTAIDEDDPEAKKVRDDMKSIRKALRDALFRRARALAVAAAGKPDDEARARSAEEAWNDLAEWADVEEDDYFDLRVDRERRAGRLGTALEIVNEAIGDADDPGQELFDTRDELLTELGWDFLAASARAERLVRFPTGKLVF